MSTLIYTEFCRGVLLDGYILQPQVVAAELVTFFTSLLLDLDGVELRYGSMVVNANGGDRRSVSSTGSRSSSGSSGSSSSSSSNGGSSDSTSGGNLEGSGVDGTVSLQLNLYVRQFPPLNIMF
jgi:uncharacterized membrane protein YgcG